MSLERPPNILFLFPDQLRPDWLGFLGRAPVRTPAVDALAARGTHFARTYCTSPLCAPSRASLAGGVRPHRIGVRTNHDDYPTDRPTFYRYLRDAGYRVGSAGKTDLHKATPDNGPDGWSRRMGRLGFTETVDTSGKWDAVDFCRPTPHEPYTRYLQSHGLLHDHCEDYARRRRARPIFPAWPSPLPREHHIDEFVGRAAVDMLQRFPREAPWFLQVNFPSPHEPFDPPEELYQRWCEVEFPGPLEADPSITAEEHQAIRRCYAALLEGVDEWCGRLIDLVRERGEEEQTMVVFASDHGDMLGDHRRWGKTCYYESSLGVPLVIAGPLAPQAGSRSEALAELPDLGATFLEWAGVPLPPEWEARSLQPLLDQPDSDHREVAIAVLPGHRAIVTERFKLIVRDGQIPVLFDLEDDPHETTNVVDRHPEVLAQLAERLGAEEGRRRD